VEECKPLIWGMHSHQVGALTNSFMMRAAFQSSQVGAVSGEVDSFDKLDWSSQLGVQSAKVSRCRLNR
jgi:hypothetical protein